MKREKERKSDGLEGAKNYVSSSLLASNYTERLETWKRLRVFVIDWDINIVSPPNLLHYSLRFYGYKYVFPFLKEGKKGMEL